MNCPICGNKTQILLLRDCGDGAMNMCRDCASKTPRDHYYLLLKRTDELIAKTKENLEFAKKHNSTQDIWFYETLIKQEQKNRDELRQPKGVA